MSNPIILRDDEYINWLMSNTTDIIDFGTYKLYCLLTYETVKHFIKNVLPYSYNINLDINHINKICESIEHFPYIGQDFSMTQYSSLSCESPAQLIDGHHRQQAILRIYEKYPDKVLKIKIGVRVHKTDSPNCAKTFELFEALNNCKPIRVDIDIIKDIVLKIIVKLRCTFKKSFSDSENPNLSNISVGKLSKVLYDQIAKLSDVKNKIYDPDIITNNIISYNKTLSTYTLSQLIDEFNIKSKLDSIERKYYDAKTKGCYLRFISYEKIAEIGIN